MAFRSRKLAKALALAVPCSSFVCPSQVSCVRHRWEVDGINGFYNDKTKSLYIYGVGEINKNSFKNIDKVPVREVQFVSIGKDVIVGDSPFEDFASLESVTIENRCLRTKLTKKVIKKKGIKSEPLIKKIEDLFPVSDSLLTSNSDAFFYCIVLKKVIIKKSVTEIGNAVFSGCASLKEVQLPESLLIINENSFWSCSALQKIIIPDSVTEIRDSAFSHCESLKEVQLSDSLLKIGLGVFSGCTALKKIIIPNSVTEIGNYAFSDCKSLEEVQLSDSLLKIGEWAFWGCTALKKIIIPKYVTEIGDYAFNDCENLVEARVPEAAKIGEYAFPKNTHVIRYIPE